MQRLPSHLFIVSYRHILGLLLCFTALSCREKTQDNYAISGTLQNTTATAVYLEETAPAAPSVIIDSAALTKNGKYQLSTVPKEQTIYSLRLNGSRFPFVSFTNDSKAITINADFKNNEDPYTIQGSEGSQALKTYLYELGKKINALETINFSGDTMGLKRTQRDSIRSTINNRRTAAITDVKQYASGFISSCKSAPVLLYALSSYQSIASNPAFALEPFSEAEVQTILSEGAKTFPQSQTLAGLAQRLQTKATQQSTTAPDFTLPDVNGKPVSLHDFKGKYVLVDFWASWCPPCRAENPNVVAAYQQFKDKNFTVLGVSLDKEKAPWLKAIAEDSLTWTHVSDLKYWNSMVVPLYQIEAIPFNILLDPQGNIIAHSLSGPALQQKLEAVLP